MPRTLGLGSVPSNTKRWNMLPPSKQNTKAVLRKLFILDAEGIYSSELAVDEDCVVEYRDFLSAVGDQALTDMQTIFMGEHRATALTGDKLTLIAVSKGPLGSEELAWAKATLTVVESQLTQHHGEGTEARNGNGSLVEREAALDKREAELKEREKALADAQSNSQKMLGEDKKLQESEIRELQNRLAQVESSWRAERERNEGELADLRVKLSQQSGGQGVADLNAALEEERKQLFAERNALQSKLEEVAVLEKSLNEKATQISAGSESDEQSRKEIEQLRRELEAVKGQKPSFNEEVARKDYEKRIKILQQKALDLLDREEELRKREEELDRLEPEEIH